MTLDVVNLFDFVMFIIASIGRQEVHQDVGGGPLSRFAPLERVDMVDWW